MRVLFVAPYPLRSADTRYRLEQFIPGLKQAGIQAEVRSFMSDRFFEIYATSGHGLERLGEFAQALARRLVDVLTSRRFDVVVVHKEAFPFGPPILERLLKRQAGALIFDLDDAFWTHPPQLRQIGRAWRDPRKVLKMLALSDQIIAGNAYLAERACAYNAHVAVIPTVIDLTRYQPCQASSRVGTILTIGWVGRWSSAFYLESLVAVFRDLCARYPQVRIKLIGAGDPDWPGVRLVCQPWRLESEIEDLQTFDIGLMPLADDEYARYKSGFKMLQYMGIGIPTVASPVGVNRDVIEDGQNGFLATTPDEWLAKLAKLIEDAALRARLGSAGRHTVEAHFALDNAVPLMVSVITETVARVNHRGRQGAEE